MTRWLAILVLVLASAGVRADPAAPLPPDEKQSLDGFATANPACHEWSDGCVVCVRKDGEADNKEADKAAYSCSTPGIACTPSQLACRPPVSPPPASSPPAAPAKP